MAWPPRRAGSPMQPRPRDLDDVQLWIEGYRRMLEGGLDRLGEVLERTKGDAP
ncbi:MAG TPA: hypothetical protein VGV57_06825 [Thermoleophilaceae bacterium]|nr:hypothetical protein [Thermoleophilaceae bacterium]